MKTIDMETFEREMDGEGELIDRLMDRAARDALRKHKRLGVPVVVWQDGKMVELQPDEIEVIDESEEEDLFASVRNGNGHHGNGANGDGK
jgi:NCAIR mutase (PurE)-related protein